MYSDETETDETSPSLPSHATIFSKYYRCPGGVQYPSKRCVESEQNISTLPITNHSDVGLPSEAVCSEIQLTIQPVRVTIPSKTIPSKFRTLSCSCAVLCTTFAFSFNMANRYGL